MKASINRFLSVSVTSVLALGSSAYGAQIFKDVTTTDINTIGNWSTASGASSPDPSAFGTTDTLRINEYFAPTSGTNYALSLSADLTTGGIKLDSGTGSGGTAFGNVVINGTNTLTLNGTASGDSQYSGGVIVLNSATGGTLTVNPNIAIGASGTQIVSSRNLTLNGTLNWGTFGMSNNIAGGTTTVSGVVSGSGNWSKSGSGTYYFNNSANDFTGSVTISAGTLKVDKLANGGSVSSLGAGSSTITLGGATLSYAGSTTDTTDRSITMTGSPTIANNGTGTISFTAANVIQGGAATPRTLTLGGTSTSGTNTFGSIIGNSGTGANITSLTKSGASTWALTGANTFSGNLAVNGGTIIFATAPNGTSSNLGNPAAITFGGSSASTLQTAVGAGNVTLSSPASVTVSSAATYIAKNGDASGTVFETAAKLTGAGSVKAQSPTTSGAIVRFSNDTNDYTGTFSTGFGVVEFTSVANSGVASSLGAGSTSYAIGNSSSAVRLRYVGSGNTSTTRAIDWQGTTGGLTLDNTGSGTVKYLSTGTLASGSGVKSLTLEGTNTGANELAQTVSDVGGATSVIKNGVGTWTLSGTTTYTGSTAINGGTLGYASSVNQTLSGSITGTGTLAKSNTANLLLTGTNSFSGAINITAGYVVFGSLNSENGAPSVALNGGNLSFSGVFAGNTATIGNLSGTSTSSTINPNYEANTAVKTLSVNQTTDASFAGAIQAGTSGRDIALTKTGSAILALDGNNTYNGVTNINGGTLRVNGTNSGTGAVNVNSGGTLGGTGSISGAVNVTGILAPGASIESLGTGSLSFATGSTFAYELNSSSLNGDLADSTGTLDIASGTILTLTELASGTLANDSKLTLISYFGGWVNSELFTYLGNTLADDSIITLGANQWLFNYNDVSGGSNFSADQSGATSFVTMTVVPEPAAALLGGLGFLVLLRRHRIVVRS